MTCLHCGATTTNGLALCELCRRFASASLDVLPIYFRNLARQQRPGRPNGSLGTSGEWIIRRGETEGSAVIAALGRAVNDLTTWARALTDDRGVDLPDADTETATVAAVCRMLTEHLTSIATLEWAGQFVRDLARHERVLRALSESVVPGWYAGACKRRVRMKTEDDEGLCGVDTYVIPGLTWVTCNACGSTTYARDHLDTVLAEASDWTARPKALAVAIVALVDTEPSIQRLYTRIRQWAHQGDIEAIRHTTRDHVWSDEVQDLVVADVEVGHARYRFGDVLDRVLANGAPRAMKTHVS